MARRPPSRRQQAAPKRHDSWRGHSAGIVLLGAGVFVQQLDMKASMLLGTVLIAVGFVVGFWPLVRSRVPERYRQWLTWLLPVGVGVAVAIIVTAVSYGIGYRIASLIHRGAIESEHEITLPTNDIPYLAETVEEILEPLNQMTAVQAERAAERYVGKQFRVSGTVAELSPLGDGGAILHFRPALFGPLVSLWLDSKEVEVLSDAKKGDHLVVAGMIRSVAKNSLTLHEIMVLKGSASHFLDAVKRQVIAKADLVNEEGTPRTGRGVGWRAPTGVFQVEEPVETLLSQAQGLSSLRKEQVLNSYLGKWYAVEGIVDDVVMGSLTKTVVVYLKRDQSKVPEVTIKIGFDEVNFEPISHIDIGYYLKARGKIEELSLYGFLGVLRLKDAQALAPIYLTQQKQQ